MGHSSEFYLFLGQRQSVLPQIYTYLCVLINLPHIGGPANFFSPTLTAGWPALAAAMPLICKGVFAPNLKSPLIAACHNVTYEFCFTVKREIDLPFSRMVECQNIVYFKIQKVVQ